MQCQELKMKLIICTDTRFGYSFNQRRQSSDRAVHQHMAGQLLKAETPVTMNYYTTRSLFRNQEFIPAAFFEDLLCSSEEDDAPSDFLVTAARDHIFAFVENVSLMGYYHLIDEILLYIWDKRYPADLMFPASLLSAFQLTEEETFPGHSHEEIIFRHYVKRTE